MSSADHPSSTTLRALIGASLVAAGRPVTARELGTVLNQPEARLLRELRTFAQSVHDSGLGFEVEEVAGGFRLVVPPGLAAQLSPLLAPPPLPALSSAALEVLAIIAYRQPVTRAEIEGMRGASAGTVITLQERELIKVVGRSEAVGQPLLYGTTERFLLDFGLASLADLPPFQGDEFSHLLRG